MTDGPVSPFRQVVDDLTGGCGCGCHTGIGYNSACGHCRPVSPPDVNGPDCDCDCHADPELDPANCDNCTGMSEQERARPVSQPAERERPEIVVLCGSTRFYDEFQAANYDLTMLGKIVLSVGFYPHALTKHGHGEGVGHDSSEKVALDELHKRKIDLADRVYVLNVNGYIGDSTRSEIEYAERLGKPIDYLEGSAEENP